MLVGVRMSKPVITVAPDVPINDALSLMRRQNIRRTPVVEGNRLVGIVSDKDLLNASPSPATSLSIWEMNYLLSKVTVKDVMTRNVLTVQEDTPIEEAARIMADNKIGGLPVMSDSQVVGIITETDLFKTFLELLGAREKGLRITAIVRNIPGQLAKIAGAISEEGTNIISFGTFLGDDPSTRTITMKLEHVDEAHIRPIIEPLVEELVDIRIC